MNAYVRGLRGADDSGVQVAGCLLYQLAAPGYALKALFAEQSELPGALRKAQISVVMSQEEPMLGA